MTAPNPPNYAAGYGELIHSYRSYLGLSQRALSNRIGMSENSFRRLENDRRECPPGFIDTLRKIVDEFDDDVDLVVKEAESSDQTLEIKVSHDLDREWHRAVVGRAAVESAKIMPILVGELN